MKRQFFIAGVQFRPKDEISEAAKQLEVGNQLVLIPEPSNRFDPNAVKILLSYEEAINEDGKKKVEIILGYVPKKFSSEVSAMLGIGAPIICTVDEVNPSAKTYEMFKVTVSTPVEDEPDPIIEDEDDGYCD